MTRHISEDMRRALDDDPPLCVAAAYELEEVSGEGRYAVMQSRHVGIFDNENEAWSWLNTGEPKPLAIKYRHTGDTTND